MNISVYGAGYVGLVSAVCLAKLGHSLICVDINELRISLLSQGICPIYEADLEDFLVEMQAKKKIEFSSDLSYAIKHSQVHIIATGTPNHADGSSDLTQVLAVASQIAKQTVKDSLIVIKSTVPVGTGDALQELLDRELAAESSPYCISVASNPEFLREGTAVYDFLNADRIIVGGEEQALNLLKEIYQPLTEQNIPLLWMSRRSAELSKYASNAMLACRISFINQISQLAAKFGANIEEVREGMALDPRIGPQFLNAGIGYGGSCFPKDVQALVNKAKSLNLSVPLLEAIEVVNQQQKNWIYEQLFIHFEGQLKGLTVGLWGLSFKPETDDLREASSLVAINALLSAGVKLRVFDPVAIPAAKTLLGDEDIYWSETIDSVFEQELDALIIVTEWPHFKNYPLQQLKMYLKNAPLFDGRNCYSLGAVQQAQLNYYSVGRPSITIINDVPQKTGELCCLEE